MTGHGEKMTRSKDKAIAALLACDTLEQASKVCGVSESTLIRWLKDPDFSTAYREARQEVVSLAVVRLQRACTDAVGALMDIMNDPAAKEGARVTAARTILEYSIKAVEVEDHEARLTAIETADGVNK